jgi:hypothetical protein
VPLHKSRKAASEGWGTGQFRSPHGESRRAGTGAVVTQRIIIQITTPTTPNDPAKVKATKQRSKKSIRYMALNRCSLAASRGFALGSLQKRRGAVNTPRHSRTKQKNSVLKSRPVFF